MYLTVLSILHGNTAHVHELDAHIAYHLLKYFKAGLPRQQKFTGKFSLHSAKEAVVGDSNTQLPNNSVTVLLENVVKINSPNVSYLAIVYWLKVYLKVLPHYSDSCPISARQKKQLRKNKLYEVIVCSIHLRYCLLSSSSSHLASVILLLKESYFPEPLNMLLSQEENLHSKHPFTFKIQKRHLLGYT